MEALLSLRCCVKDVKKHRILKKKKDSNKFVLLVKAAYAITPKTYHYAYGVYPCCSGSNLAH